MALNLSSHLLLNSFTWASGKPNADGHSCASIFPDTRSIVSHINASFTSLAPLHLPFSTVYLVTAVGVELVGIPWARVKGEPSWQPQS